jgi:hypothetical protein
MIFSTTLDGLNLLMFYALEKGDRHAAVLLFLLKGEPVDVWKNSVTASSSLIWNANILHLCRHSCGEA